MRLVVDTNVFVSAAIKVNSLPFLVVRWIDQHGGLIKSAVTEQEILSVLSRPQIAAVTSLSFRDYGDSLLHGSVGGLSAVRWLSRFLLSQRR